LGQMAARVKNTMGLFDNIRHLYNKTPEMGIAPFEGFYPSIEALNPEQLRSYIFIRDKIDSGHYIDIGNNITYLFLYIYEIFNLVLSKGISQSDKIIQQLKLIESFYTDKFSVLSPGVALWIGDTYVLKGDYDHAINCYEALLSPLKQTINGTLLLNIKFHLGCPARAVDLMTVEKKLTKFGRDNIDLIVEYLESRLQQEAKSRGTDYLKYIGEKYKGDSYDGLSLFSGLTNGYYLNQVFLQQPYAIKKSIPFYNIHELLEFMKETTRAAENAVREDMNIPRVGEGWVSETELYYKLKSHFSDYEIVQHYTSSWLEKQHLDIFFPDHKIAVEYQGPQHFRPVKLFGGEEVLLENQKRDALKKKKCKRNKVHLICVEESYNFADLALSIENQIRRKLQ
jgi:tetratricopeptide (TPR) repeat protein